MSYIVRRIHEECDGRTCFRQRCSSFPPQTNCDDEPRCRKQAPELSKKKTAPPPGPKIYPPTLQDLYENARRQEEGWEEIPLVPTTGTSAKSESSRSGTTAEKCLGGEKPSRKITKSSGTTAEKCLGGEKPLRGSCSEFVPGAVAGLDNSYSKFVPGAKAHPVHHGRRSLRAMLATRPSCPSWEAVPPETTGDATIATKLCGGRSAGEKPPLLLHEDSSRSPHKPPLHEDSSRSPHKAPLHEDSSRWSKRSSTTPADGPSRQPSATSTRGGALHQHANAPTQNPRRDSRNGPFGSTDSTSVRQWLVERERVLRVPSEPLPRATARPAEQRLILVWKKVVQHHPKYQGTFL